VQSVLVSAGCHKGANRLRLLILVGVSKQCLASGSIEASSPLDCASVSVESLAADAQIWSFLGHLERKILTFLYVRELSAGGI